MMGKEMHKSELLTSFSNELDNLIFRNSISENSSFVQPDQFRNLPPPRISLPEFMKRVEEAALLSPRGCTGGAVGGFRGFTAGLTAKELHACHWLF